MPTDTNSRRAFATASSSVRREVQALAVARDHLGEPRLVDRHLAAAQRRDLVLVDVDAVDLAAEFGEARRRDEPDVARADHADRFAPLAHRAEGYRSVTPRPAPPALRSAGSAAAR